MARLRWLPEAITDLERHFAFIAEHDPQAAARAAGAILRGADRLADTPRLGRLLADGTERREVVIPFGAGAYVLRYRLEGDETAVLLRVWHSRESRR